MDIDPIHYLAATVGFVSASLLWLALIAGLALSRGWAMTWMKHTTMLTIHGLLAVLGLTLAVVHGFAQLTPTTGTVQLIDVVVPFTNDVDPWGIGAGVIAMEVMIAVAASIGIQKKLGFHRWRALHGTVFGAYTAMTGHILISGAETGYTWVAILVVLPWLAVMVLWLTGNGARAFKNRIVGSRRNNRTATIEVNPVYCARFGFCEQEAPELFALRNDGGLAYHAIVDEDKLESAIAAARACPARAIALSQSGGGDARSIPLRLVAPTDPPVSPAPRGGGNWPPQDHSYPRNGRR
jgi:sulfoxide reductase heme-binding subunit YedZ